MKTADLSGKLMPNGQIAVPPGEPIQVVLQWGVGNDDAAWRDAGRRRFEAAYSANDSIYESLIYTHSK